MEEQQDVFYAVTRGSKISLGSPEHGHIGTFVEHDDVLAAMKEWAENNDWFPDLFFVSDHGNIDENATQYLVY